MPIFPMPRVLHGWANRREWQSQMQCVSTELFVHWNWRVPRRSQWAAAATPVAGLVQAYPGLDQAFSNLRVL
jgi:hypothetical protein